MTDVTLVTGFDVDSYIGKRLRRRRKQLGLTQKDIAVHLGINHQQVQKYECGANKITARRLFQLKQVLGVEVSYFFEGLSSDDQHPAKIVDDIMSQKETRMLIEAYSKMSPRTQGLFLQIMQEFASKEVANDEEIKPSLHLLKKAS